MQVWLYHNDYGSKLVDSDVISELEKQGWRDSPKKLTEKNKPKDTGDKLGEYKLRGNPNWRKKVESNV